MNEGKAFVLGLQRTKAKLNLPRETSLGVLIASAQLSGFELSLLEKVDDEDTVRVVAKTRMGSMFELGHGLKDLAQLAGINQVGEVLLKKFDDKLVLMDSRSLKPRLVNGATIEVRL